MTNRAFDPAEHRFAAPRYFEELTVGETFHIPSRVVPGRTTGVVTVRSTVHNQRSELVMEGEQKYLLRKRTASPG